METDELKHIIKDLEVLIRVNNLLLSRFILELSNVKKDLGLPQRCTYFKFEILQDEYDSLVSEFGKRETDKALYRLDRLLVSNKQQCPNNIAKYLRNRLKKSRLNNEGSSKEQSTE